MVEIFQNNRNLLVIIIYYTIYWCETAGVNNTEGDTDSTKDLVKILVQAVRRDIENIVNVSNPHQDHSINQEVEKRSTNKGFKLKANSDDYNDESYEPDFSSTTWTVIETTKRTTQRTTEQAFVRNKPGAKEKYDRKHNLRHKHKKQYNNTSYKVRKQDSNMTNRSYYITNMTYRTKLTRNPGAVDGHSSKNTGLSTKSPSRYLKQGQERKKKLVGDHNNQTVESIQKNMTDKKPKKNKRKQSQRLHQGNTFNRGVPQGVEIVTIPTTEQQTKARQTPARQTTSRQTTSRQTTARQTTASQTTASQTTASQTTLDTKMLRMGPADTLNSDMEDNMQKYEDSRESLNMKRSPKIKLRDDTDLEEVEERRPSFKPKKFKHRKKTSKNYLPSARSSIHEETDTTPSPYISEEDNGDIFYKTRTVNWNQKPTKKTKLRTSPTLTLVPKIFKERKPVYQQRKETTPRPFIVSREITTKNINSNIENDFNMDENNNWSENEESTKRETHPTRPIQRDSIQKKINDENRQYIYKHDPLRIKSKKKRKKHKLRHQHGHKSPEALRSTRMTGGYEDSRLEREEDITTPATPRPIEILSPYAIENQMHRFAEEYSKQGNAKIRTQVIGRTAEYNSIVLLKISEVPKEDLSFRAKDTKYADEKPEKKIVFIVHGLTVAGMRNLIKDEDDFDLLMGYYLEHLDKFDFYVIPMANPDGYAAVSNSQGYWNKNMSPQSGCAGVVLDRNFDVAWNISHKISSCSQLYPGPAAFSEAETRAIREVMHLHSHQIEAFIHVHASTYHSKIFKGDAILYPLGYTDVQIDDDKYLDLRGEVEEVMKNASFKVISAAVDTLHNWYGKVSGSSVDYAASVYGVPFAVEFAMQLYDNNCQKDALKQIWQRLINLSLKSIWKNSFANDEKKK